MTGASSGAKRERHRAAAKRLHGCRGFALPS